LADYKVESADFVNGNLEIENSDDLSNLICNSLFVENDVVVELQPMSCSWHTKCYLSLVNCSMNTKTDPDNTTLLRRCVETDHEIQNTSHQSSCGMDTEKNKEDLRESSVLAEINRTEVHCSSGELDDDEQFYDFLSSWLTIVIQITQFVTTSVLKNRVQRLPSRRAVQHQ